MTRSLMPSLLAAMLTLFLAGCANWPEGRVVNRPEGTDPLATPLVEGSIYLFDQSRFEGQTTRLENITAREPGTPHTVGGRSDSMTSMRWSLPPGVVVIFYEDADGRGDQIAIWGEGEVPSVSQWAFNDKVSRWAWYNIGGPRETTGRISMRPLGAEPTGAVADETMELFEDSGLRGNLTAIGPISSFSEGAQHSPGQARDKMTSLRWNLPPGVVVVMSEHAEGRGRQLAIFGAGQFDSVTPWHFNDRVSRWAWYDMGRR